MIITLESTSTIIELDGVKVRIWEGATSSGIPVTAFIARVAVVREKDASEFERELVERPSPRVAGESWPARMVTPGQRGGSSSGGIN